MIIIISCLLRAAPESPKACLSPMVACKVSCNGSLAEHAFAESREVFLNVVPYSFDVSVMDTYPALVTGGTVTSVSKAEIANPRHLYQLLAASALTTWVSTPSFAQMCLVEPTFNQGMLPGSRRFLFCGETLAPEVASQLVDRFPNAEVWNTYGPTETTVATTSIRITRAILEKYSPLPIGYPMPGSRVLVMDEARARAAGGRAGRNRHFRPATSAPAT